MKNYKKKTSHCKDAWFEKETDLINCLFDHIKYIAGNEGRCYIKREVPVGSTIPDIVIVKITELPRIDLWPSRWSYIHAALVWQLRRRDKLSIKALARRVFESPERMEPYLKQLNNSGTIVKTKSGCYRLGGELRALSATIISIEAKLERWKEAHAQAISYSTFSNKSIVAMAPHGIPETKEAKNIFRKSGIGLISFNGGLPKTLFSGRKNTKNSCDREYLIGSALGKLGQTRWSVL